MLEGRLIQKLHGNERLPILFTDVVNRADIGMIQRRGLGFVLKAGECLRVTGNLVGKNLRARKRCSRVSSALYTTPIPPPPSFFSTMPQTCYGGNAGKSTPCVKVPLPCLTGRLLESGHTKLPEQEAPFVCQLLLNLPLG